MLTRQLGACLTGRQATQKVSCTATIRPDDVTDLGASARPAGDSLALVVLATTDQGRNELL